MALLATPFLFCVLLLVFQVLINKAFDTADNRCGCYCLRCCSNGACRDNSAANPCQTWCAGAGAQGRGRGLVGAPICLGRAAPVCL